MTAGRRGPGELPLQLYFRIGEVSRLVGVEPHTLRYWEGKFREIRPQKSPRGRRVYSRRDVEKLMKVRDLLGQGFTLAGARKHLREAGAPGTARMRAKLEALREDVERFLRELDESP